MNKPIIIGNHRWLALWFVGFQMLFVFSFRAHSSPKLSLDFQTTQLARLSWPSLDPDWVLEGSRDLEDWDTELVAPSLVGVNITLTRPLPEPPFYWRLRGQETSGVEGGRNFLRDSQRASGMWSEDQETRILASSESVESLGLFKTGRLEANDSVAQGTHTLQLTNARNNDELSRVILALAAADRPSGSQVDRLLSSQNPKISGAGSFGYPGGGWGVAPLFGDSPLDTALALRALAASGKPEGLCVVDESVPAGQTSPPRLFTVPAGASGMVLEIRAISGNGRFNFSSPGGTRFFEATPAGAPVSVNFGSPEAGDWSMTLINSSGAPLTFSAEVHFTTAEGFEVSRMTTAATYLGLARNAEGAWGIGPESDSQLMITCEVMKTLSALKGGFDAAMKSAAAWLSTSKRNPDGGFSSEPGTSNVLETALAIHAIRLSRQPANIATALTFLRSKQLLNGSWENDPHVTAMAVRALVQLPVLSPFPGQTVVSPAAFTPIQLDNLVTDPDHPDDQILWSVSGQSAISVSIADRVATITSAPGTALTEVLTFTATDPDGLSASVAATFAVSIAPLFDYSIARGGSVNDTRQFRTTAANFSQIGSYGFSTSGLPSGITYNTTGVSLIPPDIVEVDFKIDAAAGSSIGLKQFSVEYTLRNTAQAPLLPLNGNIFNFTIQITP